jgi:hypothetical protein
MNVFLDRFYPPESIFIFKNSEPNAMSLDRLRSMDTVGRNSIKLFRGHAPLVVGDADVDKARIFTFLRDPVDRVVSFCHHLAEGKEKSLLFSGPVGCEPEKDFDLDSFLNSGDPELENLQTRMLVGEETYRSLQLSGSYGDLRQALSAAFARIEFVGIQDKFEESLLVASLIYNWSPPYTGAKKSNTRSATVRLNFSDAQINLIRRLNTMDVEAHRMATSIYSHLRRRFSWRLSCLKLRIRCRNGISARLRLLPGRS